MGVALSTETKFQVLFLLGTDLALGTILGSYQVPWQIAALIGGAYGGTFLYIWNNHGWLTGKLKSFLEKGSALLARGAAALDKEK